MAAAGQVCGCVICRTLESEAVIHREGLAGAQLSDVHRSSLDILYVHWAQLAGIVGEHMWETNH